MISLENLYEFECLEIIDKTLSEISGRDLVATGEVTDVLLDLRCVLAKALEVSQSD